MSYAHTKYVSIKVYCEHNVDQSDIDLDHIGYEFELEINVSTWHYWLKTNLNID